MNRKTQQAEEFITNSRPALNHLFNAIDEYNKVLEAAQKTVEEINRAKQFLSDLFMYRDQWSSNANYHYAQYVSRMERLKKEEHKTAVNDVASLENALNRIGTTVESISSLAGTVLQIAKQSLSIRHTHKTAIAGERRVGSQGIIEIIWEGRNHAMHWEEVPPKKKAVKDMLEALSSDLHITIEPGKNYSLSILGALGWKSTEEVLSDLKALVH